MSDAKVSDKDSYMKLNDVNKTVEMIKYCIDNSIPIVGFLSKNGDCSHCSNFMSKYIENDYFKNYIKSNSKYLFIYGYNSLKKNIPGISKTFKEIVNPKGSKFVIFMGYCKTQDGNEIKLSKSNLPKDDDRRTLYTPETFTSYIDDEFSTIYT